jgi:TatD DNase family protein
MLIDSHCHLDYPALLKDREGVLARAEAAGIGRMVNISTTKTDFPTVLATAEALYNVFCTVGAHPHHVEEDNQDFTTDELINHALHPKVVGIGETGLDYFYETAPREAQQISFRNHLRAAVSAKVPVIVHTRNAEDDTATILKEEGAGQGGRLAGVLHCFSSRRGLAEEAVAMGFYISLSGILTFKKSQELRDIARDVPMDRLLVETDSPFLAPEPLRGKVCEPSYIVNTAKVLADIKGISPEEVARQTTENFFRLFTKVSKPA